MDFEGVKKTALVLAAHTDDGELGCGATISKLVRQGFDVHYIAFCTCDQTLPDGLPEGTLVTEFLEATSALSIPRENLQILDFEVRTLAEHRQKVLDFLVAAGSALQPDLVFCPTPEDLHQDHETVAREAIRAFKTRTILCYEMPWNNISFSANFLVEVEEVDLDNKVKALGRYVSQAHRQYMDPRSVAGLARMRGMTVGTEFAEAFTMVRGVWNLNGTA